MAKTSKHYLRTGELYTGPVHKMANGKLHTGKNHTPSSQIVVHYKDLSATAKKKVKK